LYRVTVKQKVSAWQINVSKLVVYKKYNQDLSSNFLNHNRVELSMKKILIIVFFSFTLLPGCTSKFAYNNIDWLLYWYIDDYIDLDKDQKRVFDKKLDSWLTWHRRTELLEYKQHLQQIQEQLRAGALSAEQWTTHFDVAGEHWYRVRGKITTDLAALTERVSKRQINTLFDKLEEKNVKREEEVAELSAAERKTENIEDLQDRFKDWIGRLSVGQKNIIAAKVGELESNYVEWIVYRRNIQARARTLLLQQAENVNFETEFLALINQPETYQSQFFIDRSERNKLVYSNLLAQISEDLSTKQMKKIDKELQALIEDLDDLVNE
jgi:hypothetical protein